MEAAEKSSCDLVTTGIYLVWTVKKQPNDEIGLLFFLLFILWFGSGGGGGVEDKGRRLAMFRPI